MLSPILKHLTWFFPSWLYLLLISKVYENYYFLVIYKKIKFIRKLLFGGSELEIICHIASTQNEQYHKTLKEKPNNLNDKIVSDENHHGLADNIEIKVTPITVLLVDLAIYYSTKLVVEQRILEIGTQLAEGELNDLTLGLMKAKNFEKFGEKYNSLHENFLKSSLLMIQKSRLLTLEINNLSHTKFDPDSKRHEAMLLTLWHQLKPDEPLKGRISKQWQDIGFQGKDPSTDFRGMGILGLKDLLYFSKKYPKLSKEILERSNHPVSWYSFAIVGIHITSYALELLRTRLLQHQLFRFGVRIETYHEVYCYLFQRFDAFWFQTREPQNTIMDFEHLFITFQNSIRKELLKFRTLKVNISPQKEESAYKVKSD